MAYEKNIKCIIFLIAGLLIKFCAYTISTRNVSETYMPPLVQNSNLLLICTRHGCNPCTKSGIDQMKGSKDIERTTQWAEKSGLTLTFEHVN